MEHALTGIFPATATPFDAAGKISRDALVRLLRKNMAQGADGFFLGGSSAECFLLTERERLEVFETAACLLGETELIAHIGAISTDEAVRLAKAVQAMGYRRIAATPPFYYAFGPDAVARYYYDITEASGLPMLIYNFPGNTGKSFDLSHPATRSLFQSGAVFATKHTSMDLHQLERLRELAPGLVIFNGYEETLLPALALGADGAIIASGNFATPHFKRLYEAFRAGNMESARVLQHSANSFMAECYKVGLTSAVKYLVARAGIDIGAARRPFLPLSPEQEAALDKAAGDFLE